MMLVAHIVRNLDIDNLICVKVPKSDEEYDLRVPRDMAYIFSGAYIPLSCKLIEQVSPFYFPGWEFFIAVKPKSFSCFLWFPLRC